MNIPLLFSIRAAFASLYFGATISSCGCGGLSKQAQLERAAKDWCATIRASQVMPVYPLTEDIQPGDIFLVQIPIDQQQKVFREKGYLPLDNHLARMNPSGYQQFYRDSFLASNADKTLPADWLRPNNGISNSWVAAPNAAFPSYSFSVRKGAGINLAFPVAGVPVGLSLLGSDAADGCVIIKNAHTLGVDTVSLYRELKEWANSNSDLLSDFGSDARTNYVRVVSRIYTVGYVDISLRDTSSRAGGLNVGVAKPVDLLSPQLMQPGTNVDSTAIQSNFVQGNNLIQQLMVDALAAKNAAGNALPGGSLRLTAVSGRTISMRETFEPPLAIGYLGFDCAIMAGGTLGPPIPTFALLNTNLNMRPTIRPKTRHLLDFAVYNVLRDQARSDWRARQLLQQLEALDHLVPKNFLSYFPGNYTGTNVVLEEDQVGTNILHAKNKSGFEHFQSFSDMVEQSVMHLSDALAQPAFTLHDRNEKTYQIISGNGAERQMLSNQLQYYRQILDGIAADPEYQKTATAVYIYERENF
jgi:hypothetical protein